ncbi:MAG: hypothetical protein RJA49_1154 [Actinomycetota bacterium]
MSRDTALLEPSGDAPVASPERRERRFRRWHYIAASIVVFAIAAGVFVLHGRSGSNSAIEGSKAVTAEQLADQYGVKLDVLGLIASGGLIEMKFQVLDADKASALFGDVEDMPKLAVEGSSTTLTSAKGMKHHLTLLDGATYFFLYTNANDVVHRGDLVAFVMNGVRLPHLEVQQ